MRPLTQWTCVFVFGWNTTVEPAPEYYTNISCWLNDYATPLASQSSIVVSSLAVTLAKMNWCRQFLFLLSGDVYKQCWCLSTFIARCLQWLKLLCHGDLLDKPWRRVDSISPWSALSAQSPALPCCRQTSKFQLFVQEIRKYSESHAAVCIVK